jgi:hypothetical protein
LRRAHFIVGSLSVIAFLPTGQAMAHHIPNIHSLSAEVQMMYVSRHIYLLGAALVNVVLGLYLKLHPPGWRRIVQRIGSLLILVAPILLLMAFIAEPRFGMAGRSWRGLYALVALFAGVMTHIVASAGAGRIDSNRQAP